MKVGVGGAMVCFPGLTGLVFGVAMGSVSAFPSWVTLNACASSQLASFLPLPPFVHVAWVSVCPGVASFVHKSRAQHWTQVRPLSARKDHCFGSQET